MAYYEKPICGIYRITHKPTGMTYIGLSVDIFKRWRSHSNFAQARNKWQAIKQALHEHGIVAFTFEVLEECSEQDLRTREKYWIKHFDTKWPRGYNKTC